MKHFGPMALLTASALAFSACTPQSNTAEKPAGKPTDGQAASATPAAAGEGTDDAQMNLQHQIDQHFSEYKRKEKQLRPEYRLALAPALAAASDRLRANGAAATDPFCNCQDWDPASFTYRITQITMTGGDTATAKVEVQPGADPAKRSEVNLGFVPGQGSNWQVVSIASASQSPAK